MTIEPFNDPTFPPEIEEVIPAATVVVFRNGPSPDMPPELLMVRRSGAMRFASGAMVFPGGRVDPADHELARQILPNEDPDIAGARIAAIRETLEETGLLLSCREKVSASDVQKARTMLSETGALGPVLTKMNWHIEPDQLVFFAHWCPLLKRAFDTRFFLFDLGTGNVDITVDETENTQLLWTSAHAMLESANRGDVDIIFPTRRNLERLALYTSFADAKADTARFPAKKRIIPRPTQRDDGEWLTIPDDLGYPCHEERMTTVRRG